MSIKVYLGLGSNSGDRRRNLEAALKLIAPLSLRPLRVSSCYDTQAILPARPERLPETWSRRYVNQVAEIDYDGEVTDLLAQLQQIELAGGRRRREKWAPRPIDIDILFAEGVNHKAPELSIPHPEAIHRAFVLDGLKDLNASLVLEGQNVLRRSRKHPQHQPQLMATANLTPDSFSDGGELSSTEAYLDFLQSVEDSVGIIDLGAESTRPGAQLLSWQDEWKRLEPYLKATRDYFGERLARPWISVDTRNGETAARALEYGVEMINDVSGLADEKLKSVLARSECHYVLTHSVTVPADKNIVLYNQLDVIEHLSSWADQRIDEMMDLGVSADRIVFDPGIGFGKSAVQSREIIRRIGELQALPCRIMIGHSRKSFLDSIAAQGFRDRDVESAAISVKLQLSGIEILRVHNPLLHARSLRAVSLCC